MNDHILNTWAATWQNQQSECLPSEDSDQPGHPPSLIRIFVIRMKKSWVLSYPLSAQRILWSDWADAQADLRLRWAHTHFVGFIFTVLSNINGVQIFVHLWDISSQSLNFGGRRGTTDDVATITFYLFLSSAALRESPNPIFVHSLMLSSHLFFCFNLLLTPFTVPCRTVFAMPEDLEV